MSKRTQRVAASILLLNLLPAGGCSSVQVAMHSMMRRGAAVGEVVEKKVEYRSDLHEQRVAQKLAEIDDHLRKLNHTTCTQTDTTLAMEMSQSLEIQDITVDVAELKNVIARAEAQARAEALRQQRLPGLLREQREAFGGEGFGRVERPNSFEQVAYDRNLRQASEEADIVVGIDQHGHPLPFADEKVPAAGPAIGPSEIPYLVRMRINVGLQNPRVQNSKVRHRPGCGLPDGHGKGGPSCACVDSFDQQRYAAAEASQTGGSRTGNYMRVVQGWPSELDTNQFRSEQTASRPMDDVRVTANRLPPTNSPYYTSDGFTGPAYSGDNWSTPTSPVPAGVWNGQAGGGGPTAVRGHDGTPSAMPAVNRY